MTQSKLYHAHVHLNVQLNFDFDDMVSSYFFHQHFNIDLMYILSKITTLALEHKGLSIITNT